MVRVVIAVLLVLLLIWGYFRFRDTDAAVFHPNQTSSSLMIEYAAQMKDAVVPDERAEADLKYLLLYDIYIKARSYALLNKVFFWFSLVFGVAVLLWPSLSIVFKVPLEDWQWMKSATVQTTVTGIAALMFAFYSQYKDKQTYAEGLMRYVMYSQESTEVLSAKVAEELAKVDRGFSFNAIKGGQERN